MGTLIIPFIFTLIWLSIFGNSVLNEIIGNGNLALAEEVINYPARGFYRLLEQYPGFMFTASIATITGLLFYVTSADSGSLVLGNFYSISCTTLIAMRQTDSNLLVGLPLVY